MRNLVPRWSSVIIDDRDLMTVIFFQQPMLSTTLPLVTMGSLDIDPPPYPSYGLPFVSEPLSYGPSKVQPFTYEPPTPMCVLKLLRRYSSESWILHQIYECSRSDDRTHSQCNMCLHDVSLLTTSNMQVRIAYVPHISELFGRMPIRLLSSA